MDAGQSEPGTLVTIGTDREALARRVADLTRERDTALAAAKAERERNSVAMQQCEYLASEILAERRRHERDAAHAAAAAERERNAVAIQQCEYLESEILAERRRHARELKAEQERHAATAEESRQLAARLTHALETIRNMERSRFWKLRMVWVRIRNLIR